MKTPVRPQRALLGAAALALLVLAAGWRPAARPDGHGLERPAPATAAAEAPPPAAPSGADSPSPDPATQAGNLAEPGTRAPAGDPQSPAPVAQAAAAAPAGPGTETWAAWSRAQAEKAPAESASAVDLEIAEVLSEPTIRKHLDSFGHGQRDRLDTLLDWYRTHRATARDDAESLRRVLIDSCIASGRVVALPGAGGPDQPKPPPPPEGVRYAGWPQTAGDVTWWVTVTDADSPELFDLWDLERDAPDFLRRRVALLALDRT